MWPIIGLGISALFNYFASQNSANAATTAAGIQGQTAEDALNFAKQQYAQTRSDIAPWLASGKGALSKLDFLSGVTPQDSPMAGDPNASAAPPNPNAGVVNQGGPGGNAANSPTLGTIGAPPGGDYGSLTNPGNVYGNYPVAGNGPGGNPNGPGLGGFFSNNPGGAFFGGDVSGGGGGQANPGTGRAQANSVTGRPLSTLGTSTGTVKMLAPDGKELFDAQPQDVWHYKQRGAKVVG